MAGISTLMRGPAMGPVVGEALPPLFRYRSRQRVAVWTQMALANSESRGPVALSPESDRVNPGRGRSVRWLSSELPLLPVKEATRLLQLVP